MKKSPKVRLRNLPLTAVGIGLSAEDTAAMAQDLDASLSKMNCCQKAAIRIGLLMNSRGLDLKDIIDILEDGNHLIRVEDNTTSGGKRTYQVSKVLMNILKKKDAMQ